MTQNDLYPRVYQLAIRDCTEYNTAFLRVALGFAVKYRCPVGRASELSLTSVFNEYFSVADPRDSGSTPVRTLLR